MQLKEIELVLLYFQVQLMIWTLNAIGICHKNFPIFLENFFPWWGHRMFIEMIRSAYSFKPKIIICVFVFQFHIWYHLLGCKSRVWKAVKQKILEI